MENEDTGTNMCLQMIITLEIYLHMLSISSTNSLARFLLFCVSSVSIKAPYFQQDSTSNALHPKWKEMKEDNPVDERMRKWDVMLVVTSEKQFEHRLYQSMLSYGYCSWSSVSTAWCSTSRFPLNTTFAKKYVFNAHKGCIYLIRIQ